MSYSTLLTSFIPAPAASCSSNAEETKKSTARLAMLEFSNMIAVPLALNAIIRLNVPNILSRSPHPITASEILAIAKLGNSPVAATNLQRLLRLLTSYHVFAEHIVDTYVTRCYSLTEIGKTLADDVDGNSLAPYVLQHHQDALVRAMPLMHETVIDPEGPEPFAKVHGCSAYQLYRNDKEANELMRKAMIGMSMPFMEVFLDGYGNGFDGVEKLVDVGGSSGVCLNIIMRRSKDIKAGVNFDLPEVVAGAPEYPGITHVGGDMFKLIPQGDAIFMKWVMASWTEEECMQIMKNCYAALPKGGKVIACEPITPTDTKGCQRTRALLGYDIFTMTLYRAQGRENTEDEYRKIGITAGFVGFRALYLDDFFTILEFEK